MVGTTRAEATFARWAATVRAVVLVQALVPETSVGAQLKALFASGDASEYEVFCRLVKTGRLSFEAIQTAYQEVADMYEAAEEARQP